MSEKNLTGKELGAMAARIEADGPGTPYECQACEKPYDPAAKCEESLHDGDPCEEPDPDDVCRDDRARLLEEVDRLRAHSEKLAARWPLYLAAVEDVFLFAIGASDEREMARLRAVRAQRAEDLQALGVKL